MLLGCLAGIIFIGLITAGFTSSIILLEKPIIKFPTIKSLQGKTFLLWALPLILFVFGGLLIIRKVSIK